MRGLGSRQILACCENAPQKRWDTHLLQRIRAQERSLEALRGRRLAGKVDRTFVVGAEIVEHRLTGPQVQVVVE